MSLRQPLLWLLGLLSVIVIIVYVGWEQMSTVVFKISFLNFFILCLLQVAGLFLLSYQWYFLLHKAGGRISLSAVIRVYLTGSFIESVTPSVKLGGEAVKLYLFRRETDLSTGRIGSLLMLQKFIVLTPLIVICVLFYIFIDRFRAALGLTSLPMVRIFFLFSGAIAAIYLLLKLFYRQTHEVNGLLFRILEAIKVKMDSAKKFLKKGFKIFRGVLNLREEVLLLTISLTIWLLYPLKVYLIIRELGFEANFFFLSAAIYAAYFVGLAPLLPGGLGSFEATLTLMLGQAGFSAAEGLSVALLTRVVTFWFPLVLSALASAWTGMKFSNENGMIS